MDLYQDLKTENEKRPITPDWKRIVSLMYQLSNEHLENIYVMILHHWTEEGHVGKKASLPYNGKYLTDQKKGVMYQVSQLPILLQQVIALYVEKVTTS